MDISGLGAAYIDDFRLNGGLINQRNPFSGATNFEDALKRTAAEKVADQAADETTDKVAGPNTSRTVTIDKTDKLYEQCLELEIFMVKTLLSSMRSTIQKSGLIDEGFAGKMYEDMLYDEYARDLAKNANFGMAELAYLELTGQRGKQVIRSH
ncbi:MAG: rod-binding protein [Treponema sp.]|nr:rod-binding protein [Treponema sp.]